MKPPSILTLAGALLVLTAQAGAELYFSQAEVAAKLLPGAALTALNVDLSEGEAKAIEKASGEKVRFRHLNLWQAADGSLLFIDKVLGKHDFITYAVALRPNGTVSGLEIMEYLEAYGKQVRGEKWRGQFVGKGKDAPLKLGEDIDAISGATISATHVSGGLRRILQTYEAIKPRILKKAK